MLAWRLSRAGWRRSETDWTESQGRSHTTWNWPQWSTNSYKWAEAIKIHKTHVLESLKIKCLKFHVAFVVICFSDGLFKTNQNLTQSKNHRDSLYCHEWQEIKLNTVLQVSLVCWRLLSMDLKTNLWFIFNWGQDFHNNTWSINCWFRFYSWFEVSSGSGSAFILS